MGWGQGAIDRHCLKAMAFFEAFESLNQFQKKECNLALFGLFHKVFKSEKWYHHNGPFLVLLRILFFRILLRAALLLDLLVPGEAAIDEGVDEEAEEEEDGDGQDGVEGESHPQLTKNCTILSFKGSSNF